MWSIHNTTKQNEPNEQEWPIKHIQLRPKTRALFDIEQTPFEYYKFEYNIYVNWSFVLYVFAVLVVVLLLKFCFSNTQDMKCAARSQLNMWCYVMHICFTYEKHNSFYISLLITNSQKSLWSLFQFKRAYDLECHEYLYKSTYTHFISPLESSECVCVCLCAAWLSSFRAHSYLASWLKSNVIGKKRAWMDF